MTFQKIKVNILRAFVNKDDNFGNPVGVVLDIKHNLSLSERQKIASKLNFSETVFVNNIEDGNLSLFNPVKEVKFAGHALIGTSHFLNKVLGKTVEYLNCKGGTVRTWQENDLTWIEAGLEGTPNWIHKQLNKPEEIDQLSVKDKKEYGHAMVWAWVNKDKGKIRARTFAPEWGIPEDQANGSGSMQLSKIVGKRIEIHHGVGSVIYAQPIGENKASVGGRVKADKLKLSNI